MILGWSPSKFVSGFSNLQPRWPPQPSGFWREDFYVNFP
jgi:hypothetical protein